MRWFNMANMVMRRGGNEGKLEKGGSIRARSGYPPGPPRHLPDSEWGFGLLRFERIENKHWGTLFFIITARDVGTLPMGT